MAGTIQALVGCQNSVCAEEVSYHLDMVRMWNGKPICQDCFEDLPYRERQPPGSDEDADAIDWGDLPAVVLADLCE